jgi:hypothetical protein
MRNQEKNCAPAAAIASRTAAILWAGRLSITTMSSGLRVGISTCSTPAFAGAGAGEEGLAGHRAIEHHRRGQAVAPQRGDKGGGLPVTERGLGQQAPAARGAAVEPGHLGAGAGLVDEDELVSVDEGLRRPPNAAPGGDVRTVLLGGAERLFLNDRPSRSTADHIAPFESRTACSAANQVCKAAKVMSGWASIWDARAASCSGVSLRGR